MEFNTASFRRIRFDENGGVSKGSFGIMKVTKGGRKGNNSQIKMTFLASLTKEVVRTLMALKLLFTPTLRGTPVMV
jgi:hypothetical protein